MDKIPTANKRCEKRFLFYIKNYFKQGRITDADLTISKAIESIAKKEAKKHGYKNGKGD